MLSLILLFLTTISIHNGAEQVTSLKVKQETQYLSALSHEAEISSDSFHKFLAEFDELSLPIKLSKNDLNKLGSSIQYNTELKKGNYNKRFRTRNNKVINQYLGDNDAKKMIFSRRIPSSMIVPIGKFNINENVVAVLYQNDVQYYKGDDKNVTISLFDNNGNIIPQKVYNDLINKRTLIKGNYLYDSVSIGEEGWIELQIDAKESGKNKSKINKEIKFGRGLNIKKTPRFQIETETPLVWNYKSIKLKTTTASTDKA